MLRDWVYDYMFVGMERLRPSTRTIVRNRLALGFRSFPLESNMVLSLPLLIEFMLDCQL